MKIKTCLFTIVLLGSTQSYANVAVDKLTERYQQQNTAITQQYAEQAGKPAPLTIDYRYGMKIDVAKLIHTTNDIKTCGSFKKIMSYEDSAGKLHAMRYTLQGECVNQR